MYSYSSRGRLVGFERVGDWGLGGGSSAAICGDGGGARGIGAGSPGNVGGGGGSGSELGDARPAVGLLTVGVGAEQNAGIGCLGCGGWHSRGTEADAGSPLLGALGGSGCGALDVGELDNGCA